MITINNFNPFNGSGFNPFDIIRNSASKMPWLEQLNNTEWLEKFFKDMFGQNFWPGINSQSSINPSVFETSDEVVVRAEIPGIEKQEDLKISVSGLNLFLEAVQSGNSSNYNLAMQEVPRKQLPKKISEKIKLPVAVKTFGARALYRQGILEIKLPKEYVSTAVEQIEVQFL